MAVTRPATKSKAKSTTARTGPAREGVTMPTFTWEGTDKRGVKMKGELQAKNEGRRRKLAQGRLARLEERKAVAASGSSISKRVERSE